MSESLNKSLDELISENSQGTKKYFNKPITKRNFQRPQYFGGSGGRERPNYRQPYENQNYRPSKQQQYYEEDEKEGEREDNLHNSQKIIHKQIRKPTVPRKQIFTKKFQRQQQFNSNTDNNNNNFSEEEFEEDIEQQERQQQLQNQQQHKQYPRKQERSLQHKKRLKIQNLNKKIDNNELRELCSTHGKLVKCGIVWDDLGYSTGVAIVEFEREEEAKRAINDYNDAELDGEVLKVTYCDKD